MGETMQPDFLEGLRARFNETVGRTAPQPAPSPVVTSGAAQSTPRLPQAAESQGPSLLEQLRERVQRDIAPGPLSEKDRLAAFGRGVLSNRGSFLDNLTAGLESQGRAESARREEGRKSAEVEGNLAYNDARVRLEEAKQRYQENPESWQARSALMKAEADMMSARAQAANVGSQRGQITGTPFEGADGRAYAYTREGNVVRIGGPGGEGVPFENLGQQTRQSRELNAWEERRAREAQTVGKILSDSGAFMGNPTGLMSTLREHISQWEERNPRPTYGTQRNAASAAPAAPQENVTRLPL
jgi:hypothetical protein